MATDDQPDLAFFGYITDDDFRTSLAGDYREMVSASKGGSWKSVQVLAGSIIEALLVDYLLAVGYGGKSETEILKFDFGQALAACVSEKVLDDTTEKLSSVVKDYRNLIHPGRVKRLNQTPTQERAEIAVRLVKMIAESVAKKRQEQYGYTAQQVISKIERDSRAFPIVLPSLLSKLNKAERDRLLFKLLAKYNSLWRTEDDNCNDADYHAELLSRLECIKSCYRELVKSSEPTVLVRLSDVYLGILQNGTEAERINYEAAFFRASDLNWYPEENRELLLNHLFSMLSLPLRNHAFECLKGIGKHLDVEKDCLDTYQRLQSIVHVAVSCTDTDYDELWKWYYLFIDDLSEKTYDALVQIITPKAEQLAKQGYKRAAGRLEQMRQASRMPF